MTKNNINLMNLAPRCTATAKHSGQRCRSPAVTNYSVCHKHGARGGAPTGKKNGNFRNGARTNKIRAQMAEMRNLVRQCKEMLGAFED